jgi:hypothetical protein
MTLMIVKHKAYCEQPLATIDVMNHITQLFGHGPLCSTTEIPGYDNLFPREVECARPTTSLSRKARKEEAVRVARAGCAYSAKELSHYVIMVHGPRRTTAPASPRTPYRQGLLTVYESAKINLAPFRIPSGYGEDADADKARSLPGDLSDADSI